MKILVVSDNHREEKILTEIVQKMGKQVDLMIHCGDSDTAGQFFSDPSDAYWPRKGSLYCVLRAYSSIRSRL